MQLTMAFAQIDSFDLAPETYTIFQPLGSDGRVLAPASPS